MMTNKLQIIIDFCMYIKVIEYSPNHSVYTQAI